MTILMSLCIVSGEWIVPNLPKNISDLEHNMENRAQWQETFLGSYGLLMTESKAEIILPDSQTSTLSPIEGFLTATLLKGVDFRAEVLWALI